jgi:class 3 adenylate cyclase/tetratricopeptide (TPR) repeat protein
VLFTDLVGSTPLAGRLDPEDFQELLISYQQLAQQAIERYGGYTAQFLGDGVVACFGYPRAHEDDAQRAVYAGLALLDGLDEVNAGLPAGLSGSLQVRIGCHTGLVVAGAMAAGSGRDDFAMVGETPHIAARLQGVAEPGSIVISEVTEALVHGYFETEALGDRELAGVARPVRVYCVLRPSGVESRLESSARERLTPLVDRTMETDMLLAAWRGVQAGRGAIVRVSGEPGIGKSRLARALADRVSEDRGSAQRWQCSRHHQTTALYPVVRLLESRCRLERGEPEAAQREKLQEAVLGAGLDPDESVPLLVDLVTGDRAGRDRPADAQEERTSLLRTLQSLLVADPSQHPMLLVVEDLQWADPTTMELLWRIMSNLTEFPVLCVVTHRQEFSWPWRRQPGMQIELGPLASEHVRELALAVGDDELADEDIAQVCAVAGGIPLFAEEMMKVITPAEPAGDSRQAAAERTVPATLHGLLTERLDRLSDVGEVLDVAAVLGREFDRGLLEALEPLGGEDLGPVLGNLADEDVLRELDGPPVRYEFKHALLHDAAYSRVLRRRRQQLHARVASTLVGRFGERVEREPELVAHHWSCAAAPAEAARYWDAAGLRALDRAAFVEAAEHFRHGLRALEEAEPDAQLEERQADFLTHLGAALQAAHGYAAPDAGEAYTKARALWRAIGNGEQSLAALRGQWIFHLNAAEYDTASELAAEMRAVARQRDELALLAEGHYYAGMIHMYRGELHQAREHLEEAVASFRRPARVDQVYETQGDTGTGATAYLASVLSFMGMESESLANSARSLELAEVVDRPHTRASSWFMRSILHLGRGEMHEFAEWLEKARAYSVELNIRYWRTLASAYSNWLRAMAGDRAAGIPRVQASIDSFLRSGARLGLVHLYVLLADLQLASGAHSAALEAVGLAEEQMVRSGERLIEVDLLRCKARVAMAGPAPDTAAALADLRQAVVVAERQEARLPQLRALGQLISLQRREGEDASTDEQRLEALSGHFGSDSQLPELRRALAILRPPPGDA